MIRDYDALHFRFGIASSLKIAVLFIVVVYLEELDVGIALCFFC